MELTNEEHLQLQYALQGDWEIPVHLVERFEQHVGHCPDCQRLLKTSGQLRAKIKKDFQASVHLSQEQLLFYLTAKVASAGLSVSDRSMLARQSEHLQNCPLCHVREQYLQKELAHCEEIVYAEAKAFAIPTSPAPKKRIFNSEPVLPGKFSSVLTKLTYAVSGVAAVSLLFVFMRVHFTSEYFTNIDPSSDSYSSGLTSWRAGSGISSAAESPALQILAEASEALRSEQAQQALDLLSGLKAVDLEGEALLRFRLYRLMATLKDAYSDYFGLFPHFNRTRVTSTLEEMKEVLPEDVAQAQSLNSEYAGPAYYYAAKACLILDRRDDAQKYLEICISLTNHRRHEDAEALLAKLKRP
jgi:hypothetical protein